MPVSTSLLCLRVNSKTVAAFRILKGGQNLNQATFEMVRSRQYPNTDAKIEIQSLI